MTYYVGLDLGQRQDFSAIAVVERRERQSSAFAPMELDSLAVRLVERRELPALKNLLDRQYGSCRVRTLSTR